MSFRPYRLVLLTIVASWLGIAYAQTPAQSSSSSAQHASKLAKASPGLDPGSVTNSVYRNRSLALTCKIPEGWVLRSDEMNSRDGETLQPPRTSSSESQVLLAAFSRPPAAKGEDINSSIVIAAEPVASYPGLKEAAQYFYPLEEVAKAQGLVLDEDPYAVAVGNQTLVRGDFHKDIGSRVLHQSTLAMLTHGFAVSITVIAGTTDDVEELMDGLSFSGK